MNTPFSVIEVIGYVGSLLVLVSFLMTSVFKLRIVNMIGSLIFMVYALIIRSYPTALMNGALVLINLHFLWKMSHHEKAYDVVRVKNDDHFLDYLLRQYGDDIRACFPGIGLDTAAADCGYITCCQNAPAGIFLGRETPQGMEILLDYSTPEYRDFSLGRALMRTLKQDGVHTLLFQGPDEHHKEYLQKTGFRKTETGYVKEL